MEDQWIRIERGFLPPANTTVILGHDRDKWVVSGYRNTSKEYYNEFDESGCEIYPTHWMHKPKPPRKTRK